jgi:putative FmdB family regulatory protein
MPIYAYRCSACGHAQDVLQKMSDPLLTVCPACGQASYVKQVTAAGFQLKGSGWYVTDFREGAKGKKGDAAGADKAADPAADKPADKAAASPADAAPAKAADKPAAAPAPAAKAAAPSPSSST